MKRIAFILTACLFMAGSCSAAEIAVSTKGEIILIGSTPGGDQMKRTLGIDAGRKVDFIRWELRLDEGLGTFGGSVSFGEGQPNTNGFVGGGETRKLAGRYIREGDIFRLSSDGLSGRIALASLDGRVFHFLRSVNELMVGTAGWSYTLTRQSGDARHGRQLVSLSKKLLDEKERETIYEGRTPCIDLGRQDLPFNDGCLKLKWRLRLIRDTQSHTTGSYRLESTLNRRHTVEGKWALVNGTHSNPKALFIMLDPDRPAGAISFFVGDENVIFLTGKDEQLRAGNDDFGFTLNRLKQGMMTAEKP